MNARECLDRAIELELQARKAYETLALRHAGEADLRQVFLSLALEEEHHADRVRALGRHMTAAELATAAPRDVVEAMAAMAADLEGLLSLDAGNAPGGTAEVLARVVELEKRHVAVHAENLCRVFVPSMQGLFVALARHDSQHLRLLEEALGRSNGPSEDAR